MPVTLCCKPRSFCLNHCAQRKPRFVATHLHPPWVQISRNMRSTRFATAILQLSILQGTVTCTVENASGIPRRQTKSTALSPSLISIISGALLIVGVGVVYVCHMVCIKRTVKRTIHDSSQTDGKKELDERHKMLAEHKRQRADKLKRQGEKAVHDIEQMEEEIKRQAALGRRPNT